MVPSKTAEKTVLIVEDEIIVAENVRDKLTSIGYTVPETIFTGRDAIEQAERLRPDLILMDIKLKGKMDGIEAALSIRQRFEIPVIFLTAHSDPGTLERAKVAEPYGYILKPLDDRELRTTIEMALYKHEMELKLQHAHDDLERLVGERTGDLARANDALRNEMAVREEAERQYRDLVERADIGIVIDDRDGNLVYFNEQFARSFGYSMEEMRHMRPESLVLPEDREMAREYHRLRMDGDDAAPDAYEVRSMHKDGTILHHEIRVVTVRNNGSIVGTRAYIWDITGRKRAEEAQRKSEESYRLLVENSLQGLVVMQGSSPVFRFVNSAAADILGLSGKVLLSLTPEQVGEHIHESHRGTFRKYYGNHRAGNPAPRRFEFQMIRGDGEIRWIEMFCSRIDYKEESAVQAALVDITERKNTEKEMKRQLMQFRLDEGTLYVVKESTVDRSLEAFRDIIGVGYRGIAISREPEESFRGLVDGEYDYVRIAETGSKDGELTVPPDIARITDLVSGMPARSGVLIERLDYLMERNGAGPVIAFVQQLRELAYLGDRIIIISVDPITIDARDLRMVEKEGQEISLSHPVRMPQFHRQILRYLKRQNTLGVRPTYTDLVQDLESSKPTVRKHIRILSSSGLVIETEKGRSKYVRITEKGMHAISRLVHR